MNNRPLANDPELLRVFDKLLSLRAEMLAREDVLGASPERRKSRANLLHYLVLRGQDQRPLQESLARVGLSSLGCCEAHTLASVDAVLHVLAQLLHLDIALTPSAQAPGFDEGYTLLESNTRALFGPAPPKRAVHIMVTLASEAAADPTIVAQLIGQGTNAVRINCAHDDAPAWGRMVEHVRRAAHEAGQRCAIHFDLGGPKLRTGATGRPFALRVGDQLVLTRSLEPASTTLIPPRVPCTLPLALEHVQTGEPVWFDDGKLGYPSRNASRTSGPLKRSSPSWARSGSASF